MSESGVNRLSRQVWKKFGVDDMLDGCHGFRGLLLNPAEERPPAGEATREGFICCLWLR